MSNATAPVVVIPARMQSTRLPGKPLADIAGRPMIVHVHERAVASDLGRVVVACAEAEIAEAVSAIGGEAVLTPPDLPSGSDRIRAALDMLDPQRHHDIVVNMQGDLPTLDPALITRVAALLDDAAVDIGTLAAPITEAAERGNPNVVKAIIAGAGREPRGRALYFTRATAPAGDGPLLHHIGIYAYRRTALERFCDMPVSPLEAREKLEQLRALEAGMRIDVALVDTVPLGVDTPEDLARAQAVLGA